MVETRNGKTHTQAAAPPPKREVLAAAAERAVSQETLWDTEALLPVPNGRVPSFKNAWLEDTGSAFPPVPSPFAPPPALWPELDRNTAPQRSLSTIPKRPDIGPNASRPEEPSSPDGPVTAGQRAILPVDEPAALPARQPAHQAEEDEGEPRRGTLADATPAHVSSFPSHSPDTSESSRGEDLEISVTSPEGSAELAEKPTKTQPLPGAGEPAKARPGDLVEPATAASHSTHHERARSGDASKPSEPPGNDDEVPRKPQQVADPLPLRETQPETSAPVTTPLPSEPPERTAGPATGQTPALGEPLTTSITTQRSSQRASVPTQESGLAVTSPAYSQIRSISRGRWGLTFLVSLGILVLTTVLVIIASSIQQFTVFGGLPNSAALLGQITRAWEQLATDGFAQLLAIMLPVPLALLASLYIAFSIQGSRNPDRSVHVTNEQIVLQQMQEGVILILAGLTGIVITLAIPWITERAPLLLPLPAGGVFTCGFMIAIRSRSLENERMRLARSAQQEAALCRKGVEAAEARLRKLGKDREHRPGEKDQGEKKAKPGREALLGHTRQKLLMRHFIIATFLAALSPIPLTWHLAHNVATAWEVVLFYVPAVLWIRFFWGCSFALMRKDVLAEAMKPGNNRLARLGAWMMRMTFELQVTLIALGLIILIFVRLPGLSELPFIVICTICWHVVLVMIRWIYQQYSRTGRGIQQMDRRLKLIRLRREIAELRAGITHS